MRKSLFIASVLCIGAFTFAQSPSGSGLPTTGIPPACATKTTAFTTLFWPLNVPQGSLEPFAENVFWVRCTSGGVQYEVNAFHAMAASSTMGGAWGDERLTTIQVAGGWESEVWKGGKWSYKQNNPGVAGTTCYSSRWNQTGTTWSTFSSTVCQAPDPNAAIFENADQAHEALNWGAAPSNDYYWVEYQSYFQAAIGNGSQNDGECPETYCDGNNDGGGDGPTIDSDTNPGACSQIGGNWFTNFWENLENTGICLFVPEDSVADRTETLRQQMLDRFPLVFIAMLQDTNAMVQQYSGFLIAGNENEQCETFAENPWQLAMPQNEMFTTPDHIQFTVNICDSPAYDWYKTNLYEWLKWLIPLVCVAYAFAIIRGS